MWAEDWGGCATRLQNIVPCISTCTNMYLCEAHRTNTETLLDPHPKPHPHPSPSTTYPGEPMCSHVPACVLLRLCHQGSTAIPPPPQSPLSLTPTHLLHPCVPACVLLCLCPVNECCQPLSELHTAIMVQVKLTHQHAHLCRTVNMCVWGGGG
jgi:hypothetical protein